MSYPLFGPPSEPVGFEEVKDVCVTNFPLSENRPMIYEGIQNISLMAGDYSTWTRLHIGGAFVTGDSEPDRADILIHSPEPSNQRDCALLHALSDETDVEHCCHIYVLPELPMGHPRRDWWVKNWTMMQSVVTENGRYGCAIITGL